MVARSELNCRAATVPGEGLLLPTVAAVDHMVFHFFSSIPTTSHTTNNNHLTLETYSFDALRRGFNAERRAF